MSEIKNSEQKKTKGLSGGDMFVVIVILAFCVGLYFFVSANPEIYPPNNETEDLGTNIPDNQEEEEETLIPETSSVLTKDFLKEKCQAKLKKDCEALEFNNDGVHDCFFVFTEFTFRGICNPVTCPSQLLQTEEVCERYAYCEWMTGQGVCRESTYVDAVDTHN